MTITLPSGRKIGEGQPPFIIAEIGSNWRNLEDCLLSIEKSKECGADAVKFQAYTYQALYGEYRYENTSWRLCLDYQLPIQWLPILKKRCDEVRIEFMCSAFSPELIDTVDPYVNIHKLASAEMCHVRMLEKLREIGKPVFMSTGGHTIEEIGRALTYLAHSGTTSTPEVLPVETVICYCVSAYPAKQVNLDAIRLLRSRFGALVGYSDHSLDSQTIPALAVEKGACVVEKHVRFIEADSPDYPHSLDQSQFLAMVSSIRNNGTRVVFPNREEYPMTQRHNRRLIATKTIEAGEEFREGVNYGMYRALRDEPQALSPFESDKIAGKKATKTIEAGRGITDEDFTRT